MSTPRTSSSAPGRKSAKRARGLAALLAGLVALGLPAAGELPALWAQSPSRLYNSVEFGVFGPDRATELRNQLVSDIAGARTAIDAAFFALEDEVVAKALIDARNRGVRVRVVGDVQNRTGRGFARLEAAGIVPVYGDGELKYLPDPTLSSMLDECDNEEQPPQDPRPPEPRVIACTKKEQASRERVVVRPDDFNQMSHNFVIIDAIDIWNLSAPLDGRANISLAVKMKSEEIKRSFAREFQQMHGGVFATTLSIYSGPLKSLTQLSPLYTTDKGAMRLQFNPQERLVKRVIDETYRAKASVFIVSDEILNPFLIDALKYKRQNGFDVRLIVREPQNAENRQELVALGALLAPASFERLPTMAIFDSEPDRFERRRPRTVQVLSHALWHGTPFEVKYAEPDDKLFIYPSDSFVDGNMWELIEPNTRRNAEVDRFLNLWVELQNKSALLP